jgi:uncharacterized membrane protein (UPF0127 family)
MLAASIQRINYQPFMKGLYEMADFGTTGLAYRSGARRATALKGQIFLLILVLSVTVLINTGAAAGPRRTKGFQAVRSDGTLDFVGPSGNLLATITIEIADTEQSRSRGLMGRTGLNDSMGMLFTYEQAQLLTFWMRNTPTPLDIIFVSAEKKVIRIAPNTRPMSDTIYSSRAAAQYVVEVPAGFCKRYRVNTRAKIKWRWNP